MLEKLNDYLEDKKRERKFGIQYRTGFSKWIKTRSGEDESGWMRIYNDKNEKYSQVVYHRDGKWRMADGEEDDRVFYNFFIFDTAEQAKHAFNTYTSIDTIIGPEFDHILFNGVNRLYREMGHEVDKRDIDSWVKNYTEFDDHITYDYVSRMIDNFYSEFNNGL